MAPEEEVVFLAEAGIDKVVLAIGETPISSFSSPSLSGEIRTGVDRSPLRKSRRFLAAVRRIGDFDRPASVVCEDVEIEASNVL
jgi:hypothetical protein